MLLRELRLDARLALDEPIESFVKVVFGNLLEIQLQPKARRCGF